MSLIKFSESMDIITVNLSLDSQKHAKIEFLSPDDIPNKTVLFSGFVELNEHNHFIQSDFLDMKYIYRVEDDLHYTMTNSENDIYVEPSDVEPELIEPIKPYVPTVDEIRASKISAFSNICNMSIIYGVDIDVDGSIEHFSYSEEDQTNIKELFDLALQTNVPMYYHSNGNSCKLYSVDQIIELYKTATLNKMHHINYFNQLKMYLNTLNDSDIIRNIEYGYELNGEYLNTYNAAMEQVKIGIKTLLSEDNF